MDPFALIIFGITGNLSQIKLIPALYDMEEKGLLPKGMNIIGIARKPLSKSALEEYFDKVLHTENRHHKHEIRNDTFQKLCNRFHYLDGDLDDPNFYEKLKDYLNELNKSGVRCDNRIFYLATYPDLYGHIFKNLKSHGLSKQDNCWVRLMIEKPIGHDLASSQELNNLLLEYFDDNQIFRLDHYLGKETLQNILTFRFANSIFEPLINSKHIDHIQITAAEDFGIGKRGGYYDTVGAFKDFGQNHILQMIALSTMEDPGTFSDQAILDKRVKLLKELVPEPEKIVFGQYEGYTQEEHVNPHSVTDTFYAFRTKINNDRFKDIPIYVRGGKMMKQTVTEVSIIFKNNENRSFKDIPLGKEPNVLVYRIQPNEGIVFNILTKKPGSEISLESTYMQYCYKQDTPHYLPDPYERLITDAIKGDHTFFNTADEIETEWAFTDPYSKNATKPEIYKPGSWGPSQSDKLLEEDGKKWLEPSMQFCSF